MNQYHIAAGILVSIFATSIIYYLIKSKTSQDAKD